MNLIYSMMRLLAAILDMASESETTRETLNSMAESVWEQAAVLQYDVKKYLSALNDDGNKVNNDNNKKENDAMTAN